jgi:hypothetical protein
MRVPDAVQHERMNNSKAARDGDGARGAPQIRDRQRSEWSRVCSAPRVVAPQFHDNIRAALRCARDTSA